MRSDASKGVVLVVDDNPMVLRTTRIILSRAGYDVIEASDGRDAVAVLEGRPDVRVLLTDSDMAPMSGAELARIAHARWPRVKVVCMSGKPAPDLPSGTEFVPKPFSAATLIPRLAERENCVAA